MRFKKSMKKKRRLIIILIAMILVVCATYFVIKNNEEEVTKIVNVTEKEAEVELKDIETTLTAPGEVQSAETEKITLNTSYYFLTMCAEQGEFVEKGDNLLKYTNGVYIKAPYNCVVTNYYVPTAKSICTSSNYISISSTEDLYMDINITEENIEKVSTGQSVDITANFDETREYKGTITKINAIGTKSSGGTKFAAIASIKNDGDLKIGMSATCSITLDKKENLTCLPIEAVEVENNKKYVNLINDDGNITKVEVETGIADANYVQILSGVELGDKVKYETKTVTVIEEEETENALTSLFNFGGKDKKDRK